MKSRIVIGLIAATTCIITGSTLFSFNDQQQVEEQNKATLRSQYAQNPTNWPKPDVDSNIINFRELGVLPKSPLEAIKDSIKPVVDLGRLLFHDPRLSGSNQISCSNCHASDLNWTDGRRFALGNDHNVTSRNTPSIENSWAFEKLFWDGRVNSLEEQAPNSIQNPLEMNQDTLKLAKKLSKIKGYKPIFESAFGSEKITLERISKAIATYERTITSRKTNFDLFVEGKYDKLSDEQIEGLHLFRTKARCINCHNGPLFTDNQFHNVGLTYYARDKFTDLGRYTLTQNKADVGKFKTPSLRNVMNTKPWFHNGIFANIDGVLNMYNAGMPRPPRPKGLEQDSLFPTTSEHLKPLNLTKPERDAIIAFLNAITTAPNREDQPILPK